MRAASAAAFSLIHASAEAFPSGISSPGFVSGAAPRAPRIRFTLKSMPASRSFPSCSRTSSTVKPLFMSFRRDGSPVSMPKFGSLIPAARRAFSSRTVLFFTFCTEA